MIEAYRRIYGLLDARERRRFLLLIVLTALMGLSELIGVASILPFLSFLSDPAMLENNELLSGLRETVGIETREGFLVFLAVMALIVVWSALAFRMATFFALTRFTKMLVDSVGARLLERYLGRPWSWFLGRNTSDLGKALLSEVQIVVEGPIHAAMRLMGHAAIAFAMVTLLVILEPMGALIAGLVAGTCYGAIMRWSAARLDRLGTVRAESNRHRFRIAQEAFGGIKEVKRLDLERRFLKRFRKPARKLADALARSEIIAEAPRHLLEGMAVALMLGFVMWLLISKGGDVQSALPVIGAYVFAGARLFPEIQQIFRASTRIRFGRAALDELHREFQGEERALAESELEVEPLHLREGIVLEDISFRYDGADQPALNGLSMELPARQTIGLVGETGAGKSTVVDVMLGLLTPQSGEIRVDGRALDEQTLRRWRRSVGHVPQTVYLADESIAANIAFGEEPEDIDHMAVRRAAELAELDRFIDGLPHGFETSVGERGSHLSGGQRQRIAVARALYTDPDVLVFDEATSALDTVTERAVMRAVKSLGQSKTILLVAHRLSTVRNCDRIYVLEKGRVSASGTYDEVLEKSAVFRAMHEAAS
jgi:ATP-binding cassette, subfamily B, bacterial PglK